MITRGAKTVAWYVLAGWGLLSLANWAVEVPIGPHGGWSEPELTGEFSSAVLTAAAPQSTAIAQGLPPWQAALCHDLWPHFQAAGEEFGVDPTLLSIVALIESGCGAAQRSPAGAQGIMQVMPATAAEIAQRIGEPLHACWETDARTNIRYGAEYFARQMLSCKNAGATGFTPDYIETVRCASVGYNAGGGWIWRWINEDRAPDESRAHARFVGGMWGERFTPEPPSLQAWADAGGARWIAAERPAASGTPCAP